MAHSSSVTSLQFDRHFLITGGADGHVKLFETRTGAFVRELTEKSDGVWKVASCGDVCAIMCQRPTKISMEMWSFKPRED
jgi:F-box and WD-40 domain protein CDC4